MHKFRLVPITLLALLACFPAVADEGAERFRDDFLAGKLAWGQVRERAREEGQVNLYYWGGDDLLNVWMDRVVAPAMKQEGITFNPVRVTATKDAIDLVLTELAAGRTIGKGSVDAIWANGENFATLKQQNALFGSFAKLLPNAVNLEWDPADERSLTNLRDFGVETLGQEMPWSAEQYVCAADRARVAEEDTPSTFAQLHAYLEKNPGKFTYVKPPHYIGNTFVQAAIYAHNPDGTGAMPLQASLDDLGVEELARLIEPGLRYLKDLEPLLLSAGNGRRPRYPEDIAELEGLFLNGEIDFACKFGLYAVATAVATGRYPEKAEGFIFPEGNMIKNKNYLVIPANAPNPAASLVMIDYMTSVEAQVSKLRHVGMPAGIDPWRLPAEDADALEEASPGHVGVTQAQLDENAAPDTHATLVDVIEAVWLEYIERNRNEPISKIVARVAENYIR
ncbi:ABC transporter substrate-binding protein [Chelativorans sp. Marseille-P2723]|uniref:ABC transporter substrate-binding protein n=1 Tax=Chelativorans sp. Marseille-P2723 TaxID=2709133 RepID=UPI0015707350|nr:ABC transporter substrate-binding protein [Chelativorans sp. Marseille-P2723]